MNRTRLLFIGVLALALGAFASALAYKVLQSRVAGPVQLQPVVVAASDLAVGTKLQQKDIRSVNVPADALPPGGFRHEEKVIGRGVVLPVAQGEFLIAGKNLAAANAGSGLSSLIPSGMRAVSVRVSDISAMGGFITPGSRVDVLMTGNPGSGEAQAMTVLKNVAVLANGSRLDHGLLGPETQNSPVITLLVSPDDAERLALAMAQGRIQLALRNPLDTGQENVAAVSLRSLYTGSQRTAAPTPAVHVKPKPAPVAQAAPPPPTTYGVEVIKGDKRDVTKLSD
ncbi:MAG TPA: Flp pilus assembly protein CpaB [Terriglobales bacterium]